MNGRRISPKIVGLALSLLVGGTAGGVFSYRFYLRNRDARYVSSCANHLNHLQLGLLIEANDHPDSILPSTEDTRAALSAISADFNNPPGWLTSYGRACPESFLGGGSIGYVYVGDGLQLGEVTDRSILILFCPGQNHRGFSDSSRSFARFSNRSNAEMITELERAIARGESGDVNYSARAMSVLRSQLEVRRQFL